MAFYFDNPKQRDMIEGLMKDVFLAFDKEEMLQILINNMGDAELLELVIESMYPDFEGTNEEFLKMIEKDEDFYS